MKKALPKVMGEMLVPCVTYARELKNRWEGQEYSNGVVTMAAAGLALGLILASICIVTLVSVANRPKSLRDRVTGWLMS